MTTIDLGSIAGPAGTNGTDGKSAYEIAVDEGAFTGTETEFAQALLARHTTDEAILSIVQSALIGNSFDNESAPGDSSLVTSDTLYLALNRITHVDSSTAENPVTAERGATLVVNPTDDDDQNPIAVTVALPETASVGQEAVILVTPHQDSASRSVTLALTSVADIIEEDADTSADEAFGIIARARYGNNEWFVSRHAFTVDPDYASPTRWKIQFSSSNHPSLGGITATQSVVAGESATIVVPSDFSSLLGKCSLAGWATSSSGDKVYNANDTVPAHNANETVTLYPVYNSVTQSLWTNDNKTKSTTNTGTGYEYSDLKTGAFSISGETNCKLRIWGTVSVANNGVYGKAQYKFDTQSTWTELGSDTVADSPTSFDVQNISIPPTATSVSVRFAMQEKSGSTGLHGSMTTSATITYQ